MSKSGGVSGKDSGVLGKEHGLKGGRPKLLKRSPSIPNRSPPISYGYPEDKYEELIKYFRTSMIPKRLRITNQLANVPSIEKMSKSEIVNIKKKFKSQAAG